MAGLLGSMVAGAAKGVAENRLSQAERQQQFDMKRALLDAELDMRMRMKQMDAEFDDKRAAKIAEARAGDWAPIEEETTTPSSVMQRYTDESGQEVEVKSGGDTFKSKRDVTVEEAAERALRRGDPEYAKGLLEYAGKKGDTKSVYNVGDGTLVAYDKKANKAEIVYENGKKSKVPSNEIELALAATDGDPQRAMELLVKHKARVAAAGRAPASDGQKPADVKSAEWLVENGVAKDWAEAWSMVKQTKERSPTDAIAGIATKLMGEIKYMGKPELAAEEAKKIYRAINSATEGAGGYAEDDPLGLR